MLTDQETVADVVENLEMFEVSLLEFENTLNNGRVDISLVHSMFRYAHSAKGALLMMKANYAAHLVHCIETHFDRMRNGDIPVALIAVINCTFQGISAVKAFLNSECNAVELRAVAADLESLQGAEHSNRLEQVAISFNDEERRRCADAQRKQLTFYQIDKLINTRISEDDFRNLPVFEAVQEYGTLIAVRPPFADLNRNRGEEVLQVLFASPQSREDLELSIFDPFKVVNVSCEKHTMQARVAQSQASHVHRESELDALRILVVDDGATSRNLVHEILASLGPVQVAVNGKEAFEMFHQAWLENRPFRLICLDCQMPDIDGRGVLRRIRDYERTFMITYEFFAKIMMTSGQITSIDVLGAFRDGCDAYLPKPVSEDQVVHWLKKLRIIPNNYHEVDASDGGGMSVGSR